MSHSGSSRIVGGRGRNKRMWTADEDEELVKALCEVSDDPRYKVEGGGFKNCYSQGIEKILAQKLPGRGIKASPHVDSRLKVLKRKYYAIKDMIASPGFSWDNRRKTIQCEKHLYNEYCRDHPRAKGLYGVPFPYFDTFDTIYDKDRSGREGLEGSEEAIADTENGNTNEVGDVEVEEDRMSTYPSFRSVDQTLSSKNQKKYMQHGKRNRTESNCPSQDMFMDVHGRFQGAVEHVSTMAAAMELFKDVHGHFQSVVQHAGAMAAAMNLFKDAHDRFQSVVQHLSTTSAAMDQFKNALDHFQSVAPHGKAMAAVMDCDTGMQEKSMCEEPQRKAKVTAIAEVQKLGFTGTEVVTAASIFAREPNQMDMFLALPEIYKKDYILQMLTGMSKKLVFCIFYREDMIVYSSNGVDLSGFRWCEGGITRANERRFSGVENWLMKKFNLNAQQHQLKLKGLINRARNGFYWDLILIKGTQNWRKFVDTVVERD